MPRFSASGSDMYICQKCGKDLDSQLHPPAWRPDITGNASAGNVCPDCLKQHNTPLHLMSLYEHCKRESGATTHEEVIAYINRHYGHG